MKSYEERDYEITQQLKKNDELARALHEQLLTINSMVTALVERQELVARNLKQTIEVIEEYLTNQ